MHLVNTESWHGRGFRNRPFQFFLLVEEMIWAQEVSSEWESWPEASGLTARLHGHWGARTETNISIFNFFKSNENKNIFPFPSETKPAFQTKRLGDENPSSMCFQLPLFQYSLRHCVLWVNIYFLYFKCFGSSSLGKNALGLSSLRLKGLWDFGPESESTCFCQEKPMGHAYAGCQVSNCL